MHAERNAWAHMLFPFATDALCEHGDSQILVRILNPKFNRQLSISLAQFIKANQLINATSVPYFGRFQTTNRGVGLFGPPIDVGWTTPATNKGLSWAGP